MSDLSIFFKKYKVDDVYSLSIKVSEIENWDEFLCEFNILFKWIENNYSNVITAATGYLASRIDEQVFKNPIEFELYIKMCKCYDWSFNIDIHKQTISYNHYLVNHVKYGSFIATRYLQVPYRHLRLDEESRHLKETLETSKAHDKYAKIKGLDKFILDNVTNYVSYDFKNLRKNVLNEITSLPAWKIDKYRRTGHEISEREWYERFYNKELFNPDINASDAKSFRTAIMFAEQRLDVIARREIASRNNMFTTKHASEKFSDVLIKCSDEPWDHEIVSYDKYAVGRGFKPYDESDDDIKIDFE